MAPHSGFHAVLPESPMLASALENLARNHPLDFAADLHLVEQHVEIHGTAARAHCYSLQCDPTGTPRVGPLVTAICRRIIEYAIPRSRIAQASEHLQRTGRADQVLRLAEEAKELFVRLSATGEGGELLLFCIAESLLGFPQILTKMPHKTSSAVHVHGSDGIHASVDADTGKLRLWWGEAKLHGTATQATTRCLADLAPYLLEPTARDARRNRDIALLRDNIDLADPRLENALKLFLDTDHPFHNRVSFGGLGLVGFDHDGYPTNTAAITEEIAASVARKIGDWRSHARTRVIAEKLHDVAIHLVFLPFPSVDDFRRRFLREIGCGA